MSKEFALGLLVGISANLFADAIGSHMHNHEHTNGEIALLATGFLITFLFLYEIKHE